MIMVDQFRYPRFNLDPKKPSQGFEKGLKNIFAFKKSVGENNTWEQYFPGFTALTENAVALSNHRCASSACVPSRSVLFSGQYGTVTKAKQTDGIFKRSSDPEFPWMKPSDFPTIGDWMRGAGYTTHYFGKWHISGEETPNLEDYGFADWELSYPDPHGTLPNNLGHYRDYQFEDLVTSFLKRQGLGVPFDVADAEHNVEVDNLQEGEPEPPEPSETPKPWFAVASFTNPHDIASYPGLPSTVDPKSRLHEISKRYPYILPVPQKGTKANTPKGGTMRIVLNKDGFPQNNATASGTWNEDVRNNNKPDCQFDYTYKMGLTLAAKAGYNYVANNLEDDSYEDQLDTAVDLMLNTNLQGLPLTMTNDKEAACDAFMQYYGYLLYEVDKHIDKVLQTLEETGQADNTIVIFTPDHGEYGGAHHQMMEKWHSAYEEFTHIPAVVRFPKTGDFKFHVPHGWQELTQPTCHADLLPTILGLADISKEERKTILQALQDPQGNNPHAKAYAPVGSDISSSIKDPNKPIQDNGQDREGTLFMTHDTITEPLESDTTTDNIYDRELTSYDVYNKAVKTLIRRAKVKMAPGEASYLKRGPVCSPNLVHAVVDTENWKLVRYFSDSGKFDSSVIKTATGFEAGDQFELYDLNNDPQELNNLLVYNAPYGKIIDNLSSLDYYDANYQTTVENKIDSLRTLLKKLEHERLVEPTP